jgi:hypothetical protein
MARSSKNSGLEEPVSAGGSATACIWRAAVNTRDESRT